MVVARVGSDGTCSGGVRDLHHYPVAELVEYFSSKLSCQDNPVSVTKPGVGSPVLEAEYGSYGDCIWPVFVDT